MCTLVNICFILLSNSDPRAHAYTHTQSKLNVMYTRYALLACPWLAFLSGVTWSEKSTILLFGVAHLCYHAYCCVLCSPCPTIPPFCLVLKKSSHLSTVFYYCYGVVAMSVCGCCIGLLMLKEYSFGTMYYLVYGMAPTLYRLLLLPVQFGRVVYKKKAQKIFIGDCGCFYLLQWEAKFCVAC